MKRFGRRCGWWAEDKTDSGGDPTGETDPKPETSPEPTPGQKPEEKVQPSSETAYWRRQAEKHQSTTADLRKELETLKKADENRQRADEERVRTMTSEAEKLQSEKAEAEKKAADALATASQRTIAAEARVQAVALGIKPDRIGAALKLADLSAVTTTDDGEPDVAAIRTALEAVLTDVPELKAVEPAAGKGGSDFADGQPRPDDKPLTEELIHTMDKDEYRRRYPEILRFYAERRKAS